MPDATPRGIPQPPGPARGLQLGPCLHRTSLRLCPLNPESLLWPPASASVLERHQHFQKGDTQVPPAAGSFPNATPRTPGVFPGTRGRLRPGGCRGPNSSPRGRQRGRSSWAQTHQVDPQKRPGLARAPTSEGLEEGEGLSHFFISQDSPPAQAPSVSPPLPFRVSNSSTCFTFPFWPNQRLSNLP